MRSPRPSYGRVSGIYDPQGSARYSRLGPLTEGQIKSQFLQLRLRLGHSVITLIEVYIIRVWVRVIG